MTGRSSPASRDSWVSRASSSALMTAIRSAPVPRTSTSRTRVRIHWSDRRRRERHRRQSWWAFRGNFVNSGGLIPPAGYLPGNLWKQGDTDTTCAGQSIEPNPPALRGHAAVRSQVNLPDKPPPVARECPDVRVAKHLLRDLRRTPCPKSTNSLGPQQSHIADAKGERKGFTAR